MIRRKKLFAVAIIILLAAVSLSAFFVNAKQNDDDDATNIGPQEEVKSPSSATFTDSSMRWWETNAFSTVSTTSTAFSTVPNMLYTIVLPHEGRVVVRFTLEYYVLSTNSVEVKCIALKGATQYVAVPGNYWLGRGVSSTQSLAQTTTTTFVFEMLTSGTYTVQVQWRSMTGAVVYGADRIVTITWMLYP